MDYAHYGADGLLTTGSWRLSSSSSMPSPGYPSRNLDLVSLSTDIRPPSPKRCKIGQDHHDLSGASRISWPASEIPVEIFELITSHLARAEVKILRLVCREFDSKVSAQYFKNVVVPFRSELYNTLSLGETGTRQHPSSAIFSNGMRIFESFGPHILRFALSLEIDEDALAHPPIKPAQEAVASFWGIYRWPHQGYNRYADLESIEQTADETQGMKEALQCLTKVTNLGLCCDAGLGYLIRPDSAARSASTKYPVFAMQDWRRGPSRTSLAEDDTFVTVADFNGLTGLRRKDSTDSLHFKRTVLDKMAYDAGYRGAAAEEAVQILLDTEETDLESIDFYERPKSAVNPTGEPAIERGRLVDLEEIDNVRIVMSRRMTSQETMADPRRFPLMPASLTQAQKELLLELEWAHRAMIQSYVIAMVDNAKLGSFNMLTTLTIAKIPSSHVHILYRDDFWCSFPNLANVTLGVIADWRRISKPAPGCVDDSYVSPLQAVGKVYKLLNSYIGRQPSIESLQFEWICGGELAPSFFQRNQYILPAPFLEDPEAMASPDRAVLTPDRLLNLPHVKHLRLKNCWASPHVLLQLTRRMALASLENLELETFSLSGRPTTEHQFPLGQTQLQLQAAVNALPGTHQPANAPLQHQTAPLDGSVTGAATAAPAPAPGPSTQNVAPVVQHPSVQPLQIIPPSNANDSDDSSVSSPSGAITHYPEWYSWPGFLEHFSPSYNVRKTLGSPDIALEFGTWANTITASSKYVPKAYRLLRDEKHYKLKCLTLKSCGYVAVDARNLRTRALLPAGANSLGSPAISDAHAAICRFMQRSKDALFGRIIPYIDHEELTHLVDVFGMRTGWTDIYTEKMIDDAIADGTDMPGSGRFSGVLVANDANPWDKRPAMDRNPDIWDDLTNSNQE